MTAAFILTIASDNSKVFCAGYHTPQEKLPEPYKSDPAFRFEVHCDAPIEDWLKPAFKKCAAKCKQPDCLAWTFEGNKDVGRCNFHDRWLVGPPLREAASRVSTAEFSITPSPSLAARDPWNTVVAAAATHDPLPQGIPGNDGYATTATFNFHIPEYKSINYTYVNPLKTITAAPETQPTLNAGTHQPIDVDGAEDFEPKLHRRGKIDDKIMPVETEGHHIENVHGIPFHVPFREQLNHKYVDSVYGPFDWHDAEDERDPVLAEQHFLDTTAIRLIDEFGQFNVGPNFNYYEEENSQDRSREEDIPEHYHHHDNPPKAVPDLRRQMIDPWNQRSERPGKPRSVAPSTPPVWLESMKSLNAAKATDSWNQPFDARITTTGIYKTKTSLEETTRRVVISFQA